jgi:cytidyltransferase-like protein
VKIAGSPEELGPAERAVAIGTFDGVHLGHRRVIEAALAAGPRPTVLTFDPHPRTALGNRVELISTLERRLELIAELGVERIAEHNLALARSFAAQIGVGEPGAPIVRVAVDDADGTVARLAERGMKASVRADAVRLAFHFYNSDEDVDLALEALAPAGVARAR